MKKKTVFKKRSYQLGYQKGRRFGFNKGHQDGKLKGYFEGLSAMSPHYRNILVITPASGLPSLEIIIAQPLDYLVAKGKLRDYTIRYENEVSEHDIDEHELVIFLRCVEPRALSLLHYANAAGKRTVYAIDDHFSELSPQTMVSTYYSNPDRKEAYMQFLKNSQIIKVGSPYFAQHINMFYNPHVAYIPDSFNFELIQSCEKPPDHPYLTIVGYEGTAKDEDFMQVIPALKRIMNEYGARIKLEFHGYAPSLLQNEPQVTYREMLMDYRSYIKILHQSPWNIGMAPLANTLFNHCKTNNKFREYAACGIPGIYSQSPVYEPWVRHGENGLLVEHSEQGWYEGLKTLMENPGLRMKIREQARKDAQEYFSIERCANEWLKQILLRGGERNEKQ